LHTRNGFVLLQASESSNSLKGDDEDGSFTESLESMDSGFLKSTIQSDDDNDDDNKYNWDTQDQNNNNKEDGTKKRKKYVIVGAGWGGWGAAKALCESGLVQQQQQSKNDVDIIILDALPDPTGKTPYLSSTGKPVEAGTRGFWKDYPNINHLCTELGLLESNVFTEFTNSSFYSPDGLEATAPVFSDATILDVAKQFPLPLSILPSSLSSFLTTTTTNPSSFLGQQKLADLLPSPLGQILATFPLFERIPLQDRASMIGLLVATVDCLGSDETVQEQYDRMTAHELFLRCNISPRMVEDFIKPTLLVGLFKPPEELSALVVMELLYYYALAHTDSFDVRWIKNGTVSDSLIAPLATKLQEEYNLQVLGGCRVNTISLNPEQTKVSTIEYTTKSNTNGETKMVLEDITGVILAVTCRGMESIISKSPDLARFPTFSKASSYKGVDVISTRLWLDRKVPTRTPANVFSRFEALRGAGGTFFMLDQLQSDNLKALWGFKDDDNNVKQDSLGSVVACDFYNAGALLALSNDDIVRTLMEELLPNAVPQFRKAKVVDSWVGRYPGTVSWFAPGTYSKRPPLEGTKEISNLKCAGDWVRMGDQEHGAKGLCQERAYVSGLQAANSLLRDTIPTKESYKAHEVLQVRDDELQFQASVAVNREVMKFLPRFWVR
jgi:uncharacterized protein with NAD-binding domain and iron-sulfur cluster